MGATPSQGGGYLRLVPLITTADEKQSFVPPRFDNYFAETNTCFRRNLSHTGSLL